MALSGALGLGFVLWAMISPMEASADKFPLIQQASSAVLKKIDFPPLLLQKAPSGVNKYLASVELWESVNKQWMLSKCDRAKIDWRLKLFSAAFCVTVTHKSPTTTNQFILLSYHGD